jgi:PP-loop superfamily ATP-utilizing enzyme
MINLLLEDKTRAEILAKSKLLGYTHVSVDLEGYRQGSLNESLKLK